MSSLISITTAAIQGALFPDNNNHTMKVYGVESPVVMSGNIRANEVKEGDNYVPTAYGQLRVRAALTKTRGGTEYLFLSLDGGLQGRLNKAKDGADYDYIGTIDAGGNEEFTVFGRKRSGEGVGFIALNSSARKQKEARTDGGSNASGTSGAAGSDIPF